MVDLTTGGRLSGDFAAAWNTRLRARRLFGEQLMGSEPLEQYCKLSVLADEVEAVGLTR